MMRAGHLTQKRLDQAPRRKWTDICGSILTEESLPV
jgi:hypothetical protein